MTSRLSETTKRAFDAGLAAAGLLILSPLLALIALAVLFDSPGPVFYRGVRIGRFGKPFRIFKFRTMAVDAEKNGSSSTPEDDSRITRAGKLLRRHKLDELPQLFNVVKGEMSLVGPRPQVSWAVERYTEEEKGLLNVRPGVTDYASLKFRDEGDILRGSANPDKDYLEKIHPEKMRLSLEYVRKQTFWLDCNILVKTLAAVAFHSRKHGSGAKPQSGSAPGAISQ
jgi:lipopolysaccharide/colanic/teichoic acid biosynthesis glycosyltransferase